MIASLAVFMGLVVLRSLAFGDEPGRTPATFTSGQLRLYESEVKPILSQHCLKCHGGGPKIRGGFRLDSREAILRGGDLGPAPRPEIPRTACWSKRSTTTSSKCRPRASCRPATSKSSRAGSRKACPGVLARPPQPPIAPPRRRRRPARRHAGEAEAARRLVPPHFGPPGGSSNQGQRLAPHAHRRFHSGSSRGRTAHPRSPRRSNGIHSPVDI